MALYILPIQVLKGGYYTTGKVARILQWKMLFTSTDLNIWKLMKSIAHTYKANQISHTGL